MSFAFNLSTVKIPTIMETDIVSLIIIIILN